MLTVCVLVVVREVIVRGQGHVALKTSVHIVVGVHLMSYMLRYDAMPLYADREGFLV